MTARGFTLIEIVVALLVLEVAVLGAAGSMLLAVRALERAQRLEVAVAAAEGALDSLAGAPLPRDGARAFPGGEVRWTVDDGGRVTLDARDEEGGVLFDLEAVLGAR